MKLLIISVESVTLGALDRLFSGRAARRCRMNSAPDGTGEGAVVHNGGIRGGFGLR